MRSVIHVLTGMLTLAVCLPTLADPPAQSQHPFNPASPSGALDAAALEQYRAGAEVKNGIHADGLVEANTAHNVVAGMNSITEGAFANASGLPVVMQNSGANVLIQNATIVNIQLQ